MLSTWNNTNIFLVLIVTIPEEATHSTPTTPQIENYTYIPKLKLHLKIVLSHRRRKNDC